MGPLITAPVAMSNREPWHWQMIVVLVSIPPESGHDSSAQVQGSSNAERRSSTRCDRDPSFPVIQVLGNDEIVRDRIARPANSEGFSSALSHRLLHILMLGLVGVLWDDVRLLCVESQLARSADGHD